MKAARTRALAKRKQKAAAPRKPAAKAAKKPKARKAAVHRSAAQIKAAHLRAWSAGGSWCAAEAVAASLRLTGHAVSAQDVLALYRLTADGPDAGASIVATLEAVLEHGLAGIRLLGFGPADLEVPGGLILGLDMPEAPHAVCLDQSGAVWSWGGLYDLTGEAVVEEAWAVTWPAPLLREGTPGVYPGAVTRV